MPAADPVKSGKEAEYIETPGYTTMSLNAARERRKEEATPESFERRARILEALEKTSQYLAIEVDVKNILEHIAETIGVAFGAKYVNFWEHTPGKDAVSIVAAYGMQDEYIQYSREHPMPLGEAWIGRAMITGTTWSTSNIQKDPYLPESWLPSVKRQNYHGLLCTPLIRKEEIVGGMCIYYEKPHEFDYTEMSIATIVANQAATAVENAKIFADLETERTKTISIIYSLNDGLIMYDDERRITFLNPRAQELLFVRPEDIMGKTIDELEKGESNELRNLCAMISSVDMDYETVTFTTEGRRKLTFEITQIPVRDQDKQNLGTMYIVHDITREREVERLKANFVSVASHQLRTPLSEMKWSLDSILKGERGPLTEDQTRYLVRMAGTNQHMISLVNDLLDTSRIEEGAFGYSFKHDDVVGMVEEIVDSLETQAEKRQVALTFEVPENSPKVSIDPDRFELVVQNVIDNAVKYTKLGGYVHVRVTWNEEKLTLSVGDNGIGIPVKDQKFIFNKFFRAENALKHETEGSGLGLYIAKSITEKHNGVIRFETEEDVGTTFFVDLPLDPRKMPKVSVGSNEDEGM